MVRTLMALTFCLISASASADNGSCLSDSACAQNSVKTLVENIESANSLLNDPNFNLEQTREALSSYYEVIATTLPPRNAHQLFEERWTTMIRIQQVINPGSIVNTTPHRAIY